MEFVEGERLDMLIGPGGLPLQKALGYAVQVAAALERAHAAKGATGNDFQRDFADSLMAPYPGRMSNLHSARSWNKPAILEPSHGVSRPNHMVFEFQSAASPCCLDNASLRRHVAGRTYMS